MMRAFMGLVLGGLLAGSALAGSDTDDARTILDAKNGTIKKWSYAPRYVVVHDQPVNRDALEQTHSFIAAATGMALPPLEYIDISAADLGSSFYTASRYQPARAEDGRVLATLQIAGQEDLRASANVFIYMVSPPYAAHLLMISAYGRGSRHLERDFLNKPDHCYFSVLSDKQSIHFGLIAVSPALDMARQASCIYEEMTQSMGLMNDAEGSVAFTYDNLLEDKPRDYDQRLLTALYDPSVTNGDAVDKVLALYAVAR